MPPFDELSFVAVETLIPVSSGFLFCFLLSRRCTMPTTTSYKGTTKCEWVRKCVQQFVSAKMGVLGQATKRLVACQVRYYAFLQVYVNLQSKQRYNKPIPETRWKKRWLTHALIDIKTSYTSPPNSVPQQIPIPRWPMLNRIRLLRLSSSRHLPLLNIFNTISQWCCKTSARPFFFCSNNWI